ncbi:MAG: carboxypeptidase regulatory-like domain-containing protein [Myxococcales bacterium]|nr:carboxypeptidase regulatory-like domain-containing protein [Myxococcales bacterium]
MVGWSLVAVAAELQVTVSDSDGAPLAGVEVRIGPEYGTEPVRSETTDADGALRLDLPEGAWWVEATRDPMRTTVAHVLLGHSGAVTLEPVTLGPGPEPRVVVSRSRPDLDGRFLPPLVTSPEPTPIFLRPSSPPPPPGFTLGAESRRCRTTMYELGRLVLFRDLDVDSCLAAYASTPTTRVRPGVEVRLEAAPHPFRPGHLLVAVTVDPGPPPSRPDPLNVVIVVRTERPPYRDTLRRALRSLIAALGPEDRVTLVVSDSEGPRVIGAHDPAVVDALDDLGREPWMRDHELLEEGFRQAREAGGARVVLLTQPFGSMNGEGAALLGVAQQHTTDGIAFTLGAMDAAWPGLADLYGAPVWSLAPPVDPVAALTPDALAALEPMRDVSVEVTFPGTPTTGWHQLSHADASGDDPPPPVGAIRRGDGSSVAVYELDAPPSGPVVAVRLAGVDDGHPFEVTARLRSGQVARSWSDASPELQRAATMATFAALARGTPTESETTWAQVLGMTGDDDLRIAIRTAARLNGDGAVPVRRP